MQYNAYVSLLPHKFNSLTHSVQDVWHLAWLLSWLGLSFSYGLDFRLQIDLPSKSSGYVACSAVISSFASVCSSSVDAMFVVWVVSNVTAKVTLDSAKVNGCVVLWLVANCKSRCSVSVSSQLPILNEHGMINPSAPVERVCVCMRGVTEREHRWVQNVLILNGSRRCPRISSGRRNQCPMR